MIQEIIQDAQTKFETTVGHFRDQIATIRSGQTSPALIEDLAVRAYDGSFPLKELSAISVPEPNSLLVQPWDQSVIENITNALQQSDLGVNPIVEGNNIRINFPPLSQEKRDEMIRKVGQQAEEARIAVRNIRQQKMQSIDGLSDDGQISEDERDRARKEVQDLVDRTNTEIDAIKDKKTSSLQDF